uniref:UDP-glucuronate 4-epimerase n=1 Tax=Candidatus Kentrum sp. LPFa TaxID=2126335 RepID=A0A450WI38_9GAMM|nr:MAG: UDP-glucuronate 4-epimerase [Candidatus Kentron sp. LPFa]
MIESGKILVTGAAGFIGGALSKRLLDEGNPVIGVDNLNDYYDPSLKEARLGQLTGYGNFRFARLDVARHDEISQLFAHEKPTHVVNLAAQAGVRYSLENPHAYINANVVGFLNILEGCRHWNVAHLVYASSSAVYGANTCLPFSTRHPVDHPISLYAATKKSNELMAHCYSHLYGLPTTGLRFFTVYGPWGRPDMAFFSFTRNILAGKPIDVFNFGKHRRDFTYIDDIVEGIVRILATPAAPNDTWSGTSPDSATSRAPYRLYNIGNNHPINLEEYISVLEKALGKKAIKNPLPLQKGDMPDTVADIDDLARDFSYFPSTSVETGIRRFVEWYREYYRKDFD